jgi:hypothetical protein
MDTLFKFERAPDSTIDYLQCLYPKCEEDIHTGEVCLVKNGESWYHLDCAFIFKENLGSVPTNVPGFQELSEDERAAVVACFEGRQRQDKHNITGIAPSPQDTIWMCIPCGRNFNASYSPNVCTIFIKEECEAACGYYNTRWADYSPTRAMLSCDDPTCRKNVAQLLSDAAELNSSTGDVRSMCRRCRTPTVHAHREARTVPHTDMARRRRLLREILGPDHGSRA